MDLKLVMGESLDNFTIGESLRNVVLAMQCSMPNVRAVFLYDNNCPVLNDIYIIFNAEELNEMHAGKYLIEFDPFLQVIRAVNYTVSTQSEQNATWKISGSFDISQHRPLAVKDFMSVLGDPLHVFTVPKRQVLKLLYDGLCLIFKLDHPLMEVSLLEDVKKLGSQLTDVRLLPTEKSHFRCLVDRTLSMHIADLSLYGLVQIGLVIEQKYDEVVGINVVLPSVQECKNSLSTNTAYSRRVYFGQSCQCVLVSLGAPDFVYYQQTPTTSLMIPPRDHAKFVPQQFIFNYRRFGLDVVFDVEAKQVKRFIFHSNLPDHVDVNMYSRCFYKFGITKTGFAKMGRSFLVHPGVKWSTLTSYVTGSHVKLLSKMYRNDSSNALYLNPLSSVWVLFNQLLCEITSSDCIATISVCSICSDQQLGILGRKDEGLLVEASFQEENVTTESMPSSLSSVNDNTTAMCSSDVKISLPDENDGNQSQAVQLSRHSSTELPSVEPHEESVKSYPSVQSDVYHSLNNSIIQDDERGKTTSDSLKPCLPYAYPFQAYHPTLADQISSCSTNMLIAMQNDTSREAHDVNQCQFIIIETFSEDEYTNITTCQEASDHVLMENEKWRISCYSKEEQEAIDAAAAREEELQVMHQQLSEENFVCDSTMTIATEQPHAIASTDNTTVGPDLEETVSTLDQEWQAKAEGSSHNGGNEKEDKVDAISDKPTATSLLSGLEETTQVNSEIDYICENVAANKPITSLVENSMLEDDNDVEEDKTTETELVYKLQPARVAASRTQGILKTVTSLPKKHGEYQPKTKRSNFKPFKTATTGSHDHKSINQSQVTPITNTTKTVMESKSPLTVKTGRHKVHFYTEEKSKSIAAKLKPKDSIKIVSRAHKDGSAYPHHHFKSNQLSALLHQNDDNVDKASDLPSKTPSTSTPSTFNRLFAADDDSDKNIPKAQEVIQKLNTPFATEYNSTVYGDQTASQDDQTASQDDQTTSQNDQATNHQIACLGDQIAGQDSQTTNQNGQTAGQAISEDYETTDPYNQGITLEDKINNQGNLIANQSDQITGHSDQATNLDQSTADNDKIINQDDLATSQSNEDNHVSHNGLTNDHDQDHQTKQPEELGATSIINVTTEVPFDVKAHQKESEHKTDLLDKAPSPVDMTQDNGEFIGEVSTTLVEGFDDTSAANGGPNQLELHNTTLPGHSTERHDGSKEHEAASTTKGTSSFDKQCSTSPCDDSLATSNFAHHSSSEQSSRESLSNGEDDSQNLTPRKHWSTTQLIQSTPDSLNQEHVMLEHLLDGHEDVCSTLLDRMEFLGHVNKCLKNKEPISSLDLDGCESPLLADVISLMCNSNRILSLEDMVGLLPYIKQLLLPNKTDREIDAAISFTTQVVDTHRELLKKYNEGQIKKHSIEYFHCQQCYDNLEDVAKQIEQLLNSEIVTSDTVNKLDELSVTLSKLFKKLETT